VSKWINKSFNRREADKEKFMSQIRLQKYIADCGITSRRKAEDLITQGKVKVNGKLCTTLGTKVDTSEDVVMVNDEVIDIQAVDHVYLVMNKPRSFVTTMNDPEGRRTVMDLVPIKTRVFPVGRLDYLSEGLLLLTNDGEIANKIIHPSFQVEKTYEVKVFGKINDIILKKLRAGIVAHDVVLKPKSVRIIEQLPNKTWLEFRLTEGKNREIRRICEASGVTIDKLKRVAIGGLAVTGIAPGKWQYITKADLLKAIGIKADGSRLEKAVEYVSHKKTINVKKQNKVQKETTLADSKEFTKFRKEVYFETIKGLNARRDQQPQQKN
jgi:23S rRNA pseudouridine2605 synthase